MALSTDESYGSGSVRYGERCGQQRVRRAQPRVVCGIAPPRLGTHNHLIEAARRARVAVGSSRCFDSPQSIRRISPSGRSGTQRAAREADALESAPVRGQASGRGAPPFRDPAMSSITTDLATVLSTVRRPGDFFASGTTELLAPLLK